MNLLVLFLLYKVSHVRPATLFYPGRHNQVPLPPALKGHRLLHDFKTIHNATNQDFLTVSKLKDQGLYGTVIRSSENKNKQYLRDIIELKPAYLCSYPLNNYLLETIPKDFQTGMTAVLPCSIVGDPKPSIWWQKWDPGTGTFINVTIESNMRITPSNHLVIYKSKVFHSGKYRCVATNECGQRCHTDQICTGDIVHGPDISLEIHDNFTAQNNVYFLLNNVTNSIDFNQNSAYCFNGSPCKTAYYSQSKGQEMSEEGFFYGDDRFTSNLKKGLYNYGLQPDMELCTYNCTDWNCTKSFVLGVCSSNEGFTMEFTVSLVDVPRNVIKAGEQEQRLTTSPASITFRTRSLAGVDVRCYHDNRIVVEDYHTQFKRSADQRGYYIEKDCPVRSDDGYYYCIAHNIAGIGITQPVNVIVKASDVPYNCYPVTLLNKTTSTLTVNWDQTRFSERSVSVTASPTACDVLDTPCDVAESAKTDKFGKTSTGKVLTVFTTTTVTGLSSGCCYSVSVQLNNGSLVGENRDVSEYMTLPSPTKAVVNDVQLNVTSVVHHDNFVAFRLYWTVPVRSTWRDRELLYIISIGGKDRRVRENTLVIRKEEMLLQNTKYYGYINVCNSVSCSGRTEFFFLTPPRNTPNRPIVTNLMTSCNMLEFTIGDEHPERTDFYTYKLRSRGVIVDGGVVPTGQINITSLSPNTVYDLILFGENRKGRSETVIIDNIKTQLMCETSVIVLSAVLIISFIACIVLVSGIVLKRLKYGRKERSRYEQPYTAQVDLGDPHELYGIEIYHDDKL